MEEKEMRMEVIKMHNLYTLAVFEGDKYLYGIQMNDEEFTKISAKMINIACSELGSFDEHITGISYGKEETNV